MAIISRSIILWTVIIILTLLGGYWFFTHFERVKVERQTGYQEEAKRNHFLAAEQFLQKMGIPTKTVHSFGHVREKMTAQDTIILIEEQTTLNYLQAKTLFDWVKTGGHLIISNDVYNEEGYLEKYDYFSTQLDTRQIEMDYEDVANLKEQQVKFVLDNYKLEVDFSAYYKLKTTRTPQKVIKTRQASKENEIEGHLLNFSVENGMVTFLSDMEFLKNPTIGNHDHAQFLWHLATLERIPHHIWFLPTYVGELSLLHDMWRHAWMIVISMAVIIFFWLWAKMQRFGSILPEPPKSRRRLTEHVEASGYFLWQHKQGHILLHATRQALLQKIARLHPDWMHLSAIDLHQRLAKLTRLPIEEIEQALQEKIIIKKQIDFTKIMQTLVQIRNNL